MLPKVVIRFNFPFKMWSFNATCKFISHRAVFSCGAVHYDVQGGSNFSVTNVEVIEQFFADSRRFTRYFTSSNDFSLL